MSWISVIVPARDCADTLADAVTSATSQDGVDDLEVVIAIGPSADATRSVADALAAEDTRVRVIENPVGTTPSGLNAAIAASRGDVVVRLDAHAVLPPDYIATAVAVLHATGAANVGGRQVPTAADGFPAVAAAAMRSPLGSGGAAYRSGTRAGPAETVYLGVFRRDALEEVGGYDDRLVRNQDYELNHRLRAAGHLVWFEPRLAVTYRPRATLGALARQYHSYGRFKRLVMREHPSSIRLRQLAPLAMAGTVVAAGVAGLSARAWWPPAVAVGGYAAGVVAAGLAADRRRALPVATALAAMHWSWAVGFLRGPDRG